MTGDIMLKQHDIRIPFQRGESTNPNENEPLGTIVICEAWVPDIGDSDYTWELNIRLDCSGCLAFSALVHRWQNDSSPKYPKSVRVEAPPPAAAVTSGDPRAAFQALVSQANIFVDQLWANPTVRLRSRALFADLRRRLKNEGYRIENGEPITDADVRALRVWLWDNLKAVISRVNASTPPWLVAK
jgi:hypothetical protein